MGFRRSLVRIQSPRLFFKRSPSARMSKGFLIVGLTVTARKSCSNSAASWSDVPDQLTQPLSSLHDGRFKSRRPLHGRSLSYCTASPRYESVTDSPDEPRPDSDSLRKTTDS